MSAAALIEDYFKPMAARVYGDAALRERDRLAAVVARVIVREHLTTINASEIRQRKLVGLKEADKVKLAFDALVEANWIKPAPTRAGDSFGRQRADFAVNPKLWDGDHGK